LENINFTGAIIMNKKQLIIIATSLILSSPVWAGTHNAENVVEEEIKICEGFAKEDSVKINDLARYMEECLKEVRDIRREEQGVENPDEFILEDQETSVDPEYYQKDIDAE
jgi:hypothetical protein